MKKVGEIMKEMGFNADSSEATQKAFIKYLVQVANKHRPLGSQATSEDEDDEWVELRLHSKTTDTKPIHEKITSEQLSFNFEKDHTGSDSEAC